MKAEMVDVWVGPSLFVILAIIYAILFDGKMWLEFIALIPILVLGTYYLFVSETKKRIE